MSIFAFQMCGPFRQDLMAKHRFYVEQAQKRLLSQFENLEAEADKATEDHLEASSKHFNPDTHDPASFYEEAHDKGIVFYQLLSDIHENTRLSVVAGMFHQWDKDLRDWIVREMRHWYRGDNAAKSIWKVDGPKIFDFFVAFGFDVRALPCYEQLNLMRLVVNVYKHGNGQSLDELKGSFPELVSDPLAMDRTFTLPFDFIDHTYMKLSDAHLHRFSAAILDFWEAVPNEIYLGDDIDVPKWFEKEIVRDRAEA